MVASLSILIPVYNQECGKLVARLKKLCDDALGLEYEIIVADDASTKSDVLQQNAGINDIPKCRFLVKERNEGAGATRNFLARSSRYEHLIFLDCDVSLPDDFIANYLSAKPADVVNGGLKFLPPSDGDLRNLRYRYEKREAPKHTPLMRNKHPFASFRSTNFMVRREVILACPFDESLKRYEDVLWGRKLKQMGFNVCHVDNPVLIADYDSNHAYLCKVEKDMENLALHKALFSGYSPLLSAAQTVDAFYLSGLARLLYRTFGRHLRENLAGKSPCLSLLNLYKLTFFLNLKT